MPIDQTSPHFIAFRNSVPQGQLPDPQGSKAPRSWASAVGLGNELSAQTQNRADLVALAANPSVSIAAACWSILAWGGMHGSNRDRLIEKNDTTWLDVAQAIRAGQRTRAEAYGDFAKLSDADLLPGMGPAYFTKLIFFLMPRNGQHPIGYIMDQWVGCSVNLLSGQQLVLMDASYVWRAGHKGPELTSNFRVSDSNTAQHYERCCVFIEELAQIVQRDPDQTELLLMSAGGRQARSWREHVKNNRLAPRE